MVLHAYTPDNQAKAQAELDAIVGHGGKVTDTGIAKLCYIHCIVKETLRMHPSGPLLSWACTTRHRRRARRRPPRLSRHDGHAKHVGHCARPRHLGL